MEETEVVLSDQLITERFKKHLKSDESDLYYVFCQKTASSKKQFSILAILGLFLGSILMTKNFFMGLTDQRLLLMNISFSYEEKSLESIDLSQIGGVRIEDAPMDKYIHILFRTGEEYTFKVEKSLHVVKKQKENLEKICQILSS